MDQEWVQPALQGLTGVRLLTEKANRTASVLLPAIGVTSIIIAGLAFIAFNPSPSGILLLGLLVMTYVNYFIGGRDVLYPAFIYTAIWTLIAAVYNFCPIEVDRLGSKTVAIFLAGGASFSIGAFLGKRPLIRAKHVELGERKATCYHDNPKARNLLFGCTLLVTALFVVLITRLAGGISGLGLSFLLKLNSPESPLEDVDAFTGIILGSGGFLPVLALWVLIMEEKRRWKIALCAICACIFPLFVTQRGLVMAAFCGCITLFMLRSKDRTFRKMATPMSIAALAIVFLMSIMSLTKYWVQSGEISVTTGAWRYITGPLAAFNYAVYHPEEYKDQPAAVFAQVLTPLSHLQLIHYHTLLEVDGSTLDRFVDVPFPANVYTAYKPYYEDFGPLGCFVAFTLFGLIEGAIFYSAIRGNPFAVLFLVHLSSSLMFSTFDDNYHGFSRHLNVIVFAVGYFWLMKRLRFRLL
jgi:oligosaccharide repeat unit polymerase